jgi:hypothetical protein
VCVYVCIKLNVSETQDYFIESAVLTSHQGKHQIVIEE